MSKQTYSSEHRCNSPKKFQDLVKKDSFQNYDRENELLDIQQQQGGFSNYFNEMYHVASNDEDLKKNGSFKNFDSHENSYLTPYSDFYPEIYPSINSNVISDQESNLTDQSQIQVLPQQILIETPKVQPKFVNKSYCRYILVYVFRTIENMQYAEIITDICSQFKVNYNYFIEYYRKQRILIMGYQTLKKELIDDNDSIPDQNRKKAFKEVLVWYLNKLATKHILQSKKQNFKEYLKFKNYVMLYYIHNPKSWAGNKPLWN